MSRSGQIRISDSPQYFIPKADTIYLLVSVSSSFTLAAFLSIWPSSLSSLPTRSFTATKADSGSQHGPLAGLPARIFLCPSSARRINQHCRFSVINIPFYVTIIYHFPLKRMICPSVFIDSVLVLSSASRAVPV